MKKLHKGIVLIIFVLLAQIGSGLVAPDKVPSAQAAPNRQLVFTVYGPLDRLLVVLKYGLSGITPLLTPNTYLAEVPLGLDSGLVADLMNLDPAILAASPNSVVGYSESSSSFNFDPSSFNFDGSSTPAALAQARNQWAWQRTNLEAAQQATWGQGVKIAVLDTGVDYTHPELKSKTLIGYDAVKSRLDGMDVQGHGTFVAGVITQIAPAAKILPVRVLNADGYGTVANIMNGLQFALDSGANIINLSLSSTTDFKILHRLVQTARLQGVLVLSAAGNDNNSDRYYPAAYQEGMGIAATDLQDYKSNFSNYNSYMSLSAPGVNIYSMWKGNGYGWGNGTSFSTPMVAAGAAVIKSLHPAYSPDQLKIALRNTVDGFAINCSCWGLGTGRLNFTKIN